MKEYHDLHELPEDKRISVMGRTLTALEPGKTGAMATDEEGKDGFEKLERYKEKLIAWFPDIEFVRQFKGPVAGVVTAIFRRK